MRTPALNRLLNAAVVVFGLTIAATNLDAQDPPPKDSIKTRLDSLVARIDSIRARKANRRDKSTRSIFVSGYKDRGASALLPVARARGVQNPLFVIDGIVTDPPLPQYLNEYTIDCVELRPGRSATLEFIRGNRDRGKDGVFIVWTRGAPGTRPRGCAVPY